MATRPTPQVPKSATAHPPTEKRSLAPLENELWLRLCKVTQVPKVKHFIWQALSGDLTKRMKYGGIDKTCIICRAAEETVCHLLFSCRVARQTWASSQIPFPSDGFSTHSLFLNFQHLLEVLESDQFPDQLKLVIPWIIWNLWKCRNAFVSQNIRYDSQVVIDKARRNAGVSFEINKLDHWSPPPDGLMKCNVSGVWTSMEMKSGAAWILRDSLGNVHMHGRRAFAQVSSVTEAELMGVLWAVESLTNICQRRVIFETVSTEATTAVYNPERFHCFGHILDGILRYLAAFDVWSVVSVPHGANKVAFEIANSVIRDGRFQSYIARNGPQWLYPLIEAETVSDN